MMLRKWMYPEVRIFCNNFQPQRMLRQPHACYLPVQKSDMHIKHHTIFNSMICQDDKIIIPKISKAMNQPLNGS